jgi:FSR family fosmidomycin resistance protein-like MFS transporter
MNTQVQARPAIDRRVWRVASAHLIVDSYSNVYAPLLPLLIPKLHLTLGVVGTLAMVFQMAASVSQLAFGRLADRWHPHRLLVGGPIVSVVVLSLIGLAPSVFWLTVVLVVGGLGVAAFHPPGAMAAHRFGQPRPGTAMSLFVGAGATGFALSPLVFSTVTGAYGLGATWWLMAPGLLALAWILRDMPAVPGGAHAAGSGLRALRPYRKPLGLLYLIVVLRTIAGLSFVTFVPILLTGRGLTVSQAGVVVAVYLLASSAGGFAGGPLADRFGPRRVIGSTLVAAVPFLATAPLFDGYAFTITLAIGGFLLQSTQPVSVAFGQTIAPVSAATVSSLMMGVAWGTGGLLIPFIGLLADRVGVPATLSTMALVPLLGALCAVPLPDHAHCHVESPEADQIAT